MLPPHLRRVFSRFGNIKSLVVGLAILASLSLSIALLLLSNLARGVGNAPSPLIASLDSWEGIAEIGPASSPSSWQASKPIVLLMAYTGWSGVYSAASAQGPVLGTPFAFTSSVAKRLVKLIGDTPSLKTVIVHGIPPGTVDFAHMLKADVPSVKIIFVYHGSTSAPFHVAESNLLFDLVTASKDGIIDALGFVKLGLGDTFKQFGARNTFTVPNFPSISMVLPTLKYSFKDGRTHVGILVSSGAFHKNVVTQVVAACALSNVVVHVTVKPGVLYLQDCDIVETGILSHSNFLLEVSRMDLLMYVSLTECYPMLVLEAITQGIPVVVSRTHHIFDVDPVLSTALVVAEADNTNEITEKMAAAVESTKSLQTRLLSLASCLRRQAELTWGNVLKLSADESRRLQLVEFADRGRLARTAGCPPRLSSAVQLPDASGIRFRVAFITYELSPVLPGGAGVVITSIVEDLLQAGHSVTLLAYMSETAVAEWCRIMEAKGWIVGAARQLTVHVVSNLAREAKLDLRGCGPRNIFLRRSWLFARAAQAAYSLAPFDAIEVFDYAGAGFELTRRLAEWRQANVRGDAASAAKPYLPENVPIIVRLHGTLQLIHQQEGIFVEEASARTPRPCLISDSERDAWPLMYLMEQYTLRAVHLLLPQSLALQKVFTQAYGVADGRMLLAPPPMARITAPLRASARSAPVLFSSNDAIAGGGSRPQLRAAGPAAGAGTPAELCLLVYGRVMRVKGAETIAAAASKIDAMLPEGVVLRLIFAGLDWECPFHQRPTSQCVLELLPSGSRITFLGPLDRGELVQLLPTVHGAIFASEFETFGMAAHELAAAGLPLVVSDIPAYAEFFTNRNAYVFSSGDPESLVKAVASLFSDLEGGAPRVSKLEYPDAVSPYERVAAACKQRGGIPAPSADLRLLEAAISRLEGECWPSPGVCGGD